jgi:hypothetical protein
MHFTRLDTECNHHDGYTEMQHDCRFALCYRDIFGRTQQ